jgi:hypothetical protein
MRASDDIGTDGVGVEAVAMAVVYSNRGRWRGAGGVSRAPAIHQSQRRRKRTMR